MQPSVTSCTLLDQARSKNTAAWDQLVTLYTPLVEHWCRRAGVAASEVQDVVQETFLSVSLSLADFEPQRTGSFRKWMRGIARHKALDHFRRVRGEAVAAGGTIAQEMIHSLPEEEDSETESSEMSGLHARALDLIRGQFEARTWQAFWRATVDAQATDIVAGELGMTAVAVRIAKSRVLAKLREELGVLIN